MGNVNVRFDPVLKYIIVRIIRASPYNTTTYNPQELTLHRQSDHLKEDPGKYSVYSVLRSEVPIVEASFSLFSQATVDLHRIQWADLNMNQGLGKLLYLGRLSKYLPSRLNGIISHVRVQLYYMDM
jgi:hypothetical protein